MDSHQIVEGLIWYLMLICLLTFHEFGHAWTAWMCGDDTARLQGRVSLNPAVHVDPIGTVLLPLLMIFLPVGISRFMIGWAKPVPVNPYNLRRPRLDDILVTLAGPGMNLVLAVVLVGGARIAQLAHGDAAAELFLEAAQLSLLLCFFNLLLPIPPLDGSQIMRVLTGMSLEPSAQFSRFGYFILIVALQIPAVRWFLSMVTALALNLLCFCFGVN